jgi:hypothetical protein
MTARAIPSAGDVFDSECPDCPEFTAQSVGQLATVAILARHDRRFHPQAYEPARHSPSVRDLPATIHTVAAGGVLPTFDPAARGTREIDGDGHTTRLRIQETNHEMSSK